MAPLGERLKQIREEAGFSIDDFSEKTKIQKKYLQYLESEQFDKLPNSVYVRAFIKKYAQLCNQPQEDFLQQFYRENKLLHTPSHSTPFNLGKKTFVITSRQIIIVLAITLLVGGLGYFSYNQKVLRDEPAVEVFSPNEFSTVSELDSVLIEGQSKNIKELFVNGTSVDINSAGMFNHTYHLEAGLNTIIIKAISKKGENVEVIRKVLKL